MTRQALTRLLAATFAAQTLACSRAPTVSQTLFILNARDVEGLDPHTSGELFQTQTVLANLYEGLVALNAEMTLVPALAVSWSNPDDRTWDFELRPRVAFHTGETLTAEDVVFSLNRARTHPRATVRAALANLEGVEALSPSRVRLRTREPDASLVYSLRGVHILSRRFVETRGEGALAQTSCGTGAYRLAAREPGSWTELERFDGYWKGPPAVPRARFVARSYGDADVSRFVSPGGRFLFWAQPGTDLYKQALKEAVPHYGMSLSITYLSFDLRGPTTPAVRLASGEHRNPFLDASVREAIARSIDYEGLKRDAMGGEAFVPTQLIPTVILGFDPALKDPFQDKAEARRLMAGTPFHRGFDVDLHLRDLMARYAPPLSRDLEGIGIRTTVKTLPEGAFFEGARSGAFSLYVLRFSCRTGDAQEFFDKWAHSRDAKRGYGEFNFSYETNPIPGLDREIEEARRELHPPSRVLMLRRIMRRMVEARLAIPLLAEKNLVFMSPDVEWTPRPDAFLVMNELRFRESPSGAR